MLAENIAEMLRARHNEDVFVQECKLGPHGSRRIDAWVMRRSWAPVTMIGYEVKVNRNDFIRDEKWNSYLPVCNQLYFACPWGLIKPDELPSEVGLMWANKKGTMLVTKKKAPRRDIDIQQALRLMVYILMSRTRITANMFDTGPEVPGRRSIEECEKRRREVECAEARGQLAQFVGAHVRKTVEEHRVARAIAEYRARDAEIKLQGLIDSLSDMGVRYQPDIGISASAAALGVAKALGLATPEDLKMLGDLACGLADFVTMAKRREK